jgi:hypothetical protein
MNSGFMFMYRIWLDSWWDDKFRLLYYITGLNKVFVFYDRIHISTVHKYTVDSFKKGKQLMWSSLMKHTYPSFGELRLSDSYPAFFSPDRDDF